MDQLLTSVLELRREFEDQSNSPPDNYAPHLSMKGWESGLVKVTLQQIGKTAHQVGELYPSTRNGIERLLDRIDAHAGNMDKTCNSRTRYGISTGDFLEETDDFLQSSTAFYSNCDELKLKVRELLQYLEDALNQPPSETEKSQGDERARGMVTIVKEKETIREIVKIRCGYCRMLYEESLSTCPKCGGSK